MRADQAELVPEAAERARAITLQWLECIECENDELENLLELGDSIVPTLRTVLKHGPSPARLESVREHLVAGQKYVQQYGETHTLYSNRFDATKHVSEYLENFKILYQVRAAIALRHLDEELVTSALESASMVSLPNDVIEAIERPLTEIHSK